MLILLSNDDGIYAPGLAALEQELQTLGEVIVVAPATEQSGVSHSITHLTPITAKEVYVRDEHWGWAVDGTPADSVKVGISEFCGGRRPDLVVSGINGGLNAGINVLYSGTMAAAIEGAFYRIPSIAVSLEYAENARFDRAAKLAVSIIRQVLAQRDPETLLYNLNIPTRAVLRDATDPPTDVRVVPMDDTQYWEKMVKRYDPSGRAYYWVTGAPQPNDDGRVTDLSTLFEGHIALTPLKFNLTDRQSMESMASWTFELPELVDEVEDASRGPAIRFLRTRGESSGGHY